MTGTAPVAALLLTRTAALAQPKAIPLWPDGPPGRIDDGQPEQTTKRDGIERVAHVHEPALYPYLCPAQRNSGAAVVICPGGAYGIVAIDHEGRDVARWLNTFGVNAFVLKYRLSPYHHPVPLMDAQRAMRLVRSRASEWAIDPDRIGIMGFSAGGHLASTVGTYFDRPVKTGGPLAAVSCRPDFMILGYPVISFIDAEIAHRGSRRNLLGAADAPKLFESLSAERQVSVETPPAFLFHAKDDHGVSPENSLAFQRALRQAGVPAEVLLLDTGGHGFGLRRDEWTEPCRQWLVKQEFVGREHVSAAAP